MKALFFLNSFAGGGAERACLNLAEQLYKMNIESDFVTVYNAKPDYDVPDYIQTFSLRVDAQSVFGDTLLNVLKGVHKVNQFISGKEYVLITAHLQPSQLLASLTKVGRKCLYVEHVSRREADKYNSKLFREGSRLFLRGKKIVTVSNGLRDELMKEYGFPDKYVIPIYNPCAVAKIKNESGREAVSHKRAYILVMGRLEEQKKPLLALELFYRGKFYNNYDLVYLGKGSLEDSLKKQIASYHLENYVSLKGFQKNPESWIRGASLLLSCSKYEGLSMNLIEALICGTPVVASDCSHGPGEILIGSLEEYLIYPEEKPEESIAVIASALKSYPEVTKEYYRKFDDELITKTYLNTWRNYFC